MRICPPEISDLFATKYRVAHIGRDKDYLTVAAPTKGTEDARLKSWVEDLIFITNDKRLLRAGAFPNKHRGVFVLDGDAASLFHLARLVFNARDWLRHDYDMRNRRFIITRDSMVEVASSGEVIQKWAHRSV
jgi:hypothetical protein